MAVIPGSRFSPPPGKPNFKKKKLADVNLRTGKFEDEPGNFFADQGFLFPGSSSKFPVRKFTSASFFFEVGFARWRAKPASWNRSHLRPLLSAVHARHFSRSVVGSLATKQSCLRASAPSTEVSISGPEWQLTLPSHRCRNRM